MLLLLPLLENVVLHLPPTIMCNDFITHFAHFVLYRTAQ